MLKNAKFAFVALIFLGIAKLLQVSLLGTDYTKPKKSSYAKQAVTAPAKKEQKKAKPETKDVISEKDENLVSQVSKKEEEPVFEESVPESENNTDIDATPASNSLDDLKNNYLFPIISKLPTGQLREDVVVRYYRHEKDGDKVDVLHDLGYYIHEKEATETAGFGSNVLYYGNSVPVEDIRIVALTLLNSGISLKSIQRSRFDWKSSSLEVGTDMKLVETADITEDYVMHFTK